MKLNNLIIAGLAVFAGLVNIATAAPATTPKVTGVSPLECVSQAGAETKCAITITGSNLMGHTPSVGSQTIEDLDNSKDNKMTFKLKLAADAEFDATPVQVATVVTPFKIEGWKQAEKEDQDKKDARILSKIPRYAPGTNDAVARRAATEALAEAKKAASVAEAATKANSKMFNAFEVATTRLNGGELLTGYDINHQPVYQKVEGEIPTLRRQVNDTYSKAEVDSLVAAAEARANDRIATVAGAAADGFKNLSVGATYTVQTGGGGLFSGKKNTIEKSATVTVTGAANAAATLRELQAQAARAAAEARK